MGLRKKILIRVKAIIGRKSSPAELPPENYNSPEAQIRPGQHPGVETNSSRPNFPGEGNRRDIQTERPESTIGCRESSIAPTASRFDGERLTINTQNTPADSSLRAQDLGQHNKDRKYANNQKDIGDTEKLYAIRGINTSTSDNRNRRAAAGNDKDRELLVPSGQPPSGHSLSESMRFDGITNSGISTGSGTVNVSNVFHNNPNERIRPGLKRLEKRVATAAFHNSAQRVDPPRCHPDTRVAIQRQIYDWIVLQLVARQTWIMWMHGAAGAGKSAIMQSTAERCETERIAIASFFFFRTDPTRNSMAPFIATLVYQLIQKIPQAENQILTIIEKNPLIFDESLESQFQKLIIGPLLGLQEHITRFFVILIDGLDECLERAHQTDLIRLLATVSRSRSCPVMFLVGSRREPQIETAFTRKQVSDLVTTLPLDNSDIEQTSDDIRHFLTDKFQDITETHLHRHLLSNDWPPESAVEEIVTKSSGQFIYASVVINYVSSPRGNPARLLDVVRGIRLGDPSSHNPFAHLDALYQYIFSKVEVLDKVLDILALILITKTSNVTFIEDLFLLEHGELAVYMVDLTAVIDCDTFENGGIKFLHASLPDFLRDITRSEKYHINIEEYTQKLLFKALNKEPQIPDPPLQTNHLDRNTSRHEYCCLLMIETLLSIGVKASYHLQHLFMTFSLEFDEIFRRESHLTPSLISILTYLKLLDFDDKGQAYHHILDMFAAGIAKHWPSVSNYGKEKVRGLPDLLARIGEIRQEELSL